MYLSGESNNERRSHTTLSQRDQLPAQFDRFRHVE